MHGRAGGCRRPQLGRLTKDLFLKVGWLGGHVTRFPLSAVIGSWSKEEVGVKHDLWKWAVGQDRHFVHCLGVWLGYTRVSGALSEENQGEQNRQCETVALCRRKEMVG